MEFEETVARLFKGWREKPSVSNHSVSDAQKELEANYLKTKKDFHNSYIATQQTYDFATRIVYRAINDTSKDSGIDFWQLPDEILTLIMDVTVYAIKQENFFEFKDVDFSREIPLSRQIEIKQYLEQVQLRVYDDDEMLLCFQISFWHVIEHFLLSIQSLVNIDNKKKAFQLDITYAIENLPYHLEEMLISFFTDKNDQYGIFSNIRNQILNNADEASGYPPYRTPQERDEKPCTLPEKSKLRDAELIKAYVGDTYLEKLFDSKIDFAIPLDLRFEHCHILAGTGHGKTQLIQRLILDDIEAGRGCMVIDSQCDMINKLSMLKIFDPAAADSLSEKLIIIDPEDVDYPPSLNMFSLDTDGGEVTNLQKQMLINSTVDLYEYMFGALFGAELTSKQGVIFRYVAKLMAEIPNATIHTLRELLEDGKQFQPYMDNLEGSSKAFFETQFFSTSFGQTKKQIVSRLWTVLSNQTLENFFSSQKNSIDIFDAMQSGKIVLVNTSKQLLQADGSQLLGRFFIALTAQAVIKRASIPESQRNPYMVYIDEAQEYFDEKLEEMLNQARKRRVSFTITHQELSQLKGLKGTVFSSTSVKLAGGISARDSVDMAHEMHCKSDFLLNMKKSKTGTEFACYLKNHLDSAIPLTFPFGKLESQAVMSADSYALLVEGMRAKYCSHVSTLSYGSIDTSKEQTKDDSYEKVPTNSAVDSKTIKEQQPAESKDEEPAAEIAEKETPQEKPIPKSSTKASPKTDPVSVTEGKGGSIHRYLQTLVKKIGAERGFYSVIESPVFGGHGSVDIALSGHNRNIAVEVSVSTQGSWESSNIAKCLSADFDTVIILSSEREHIDKMQNDLTDEFSAQIASGKLHFFQTEQLISFLDEIQKHSITDENTIDGYNVKVNYVPIDETEADIREEAIANILLNKN